MPRIPGVPTINPVDQPLMKPNEAGKVGGAISALGEVGEQNASMEWHIRKAQANVDELAAQNDYNAAMMKYDEDLRKTENSRDVPTVAGQAHDNLNEIQKKWENSPGLVAIQQQGDGLRARIDHVGQVRGIDLAGKEGIAQAGIQLQTLIPQLVTAQRNGDKGLVDFINTRIDSMYGGLVDSGLMSSANKEIAMNAVQIQFRQQINEAAMQSANPKERLQAIKQLNEGGDGPLNLAGLAPGDIAALRTKAESENQRLDNLAEAGQINGALNITHAAFQAPEYQHNYDAQVNSLEDGEWLTKHGIVSADGSPDRIMADKLIGEANRQRAEFQRVEHDNDNKALDKIGPMIDDNHLNQGQLHQMLDHENVSPAVRSKMVAKWRANANEDFRLQHESYQIQREMKTDRNESISNDYLYRIANGELPDELEVKTTPGLSKGGQASVLGAIKLAKEKPDFVNGLKILQNSVPYTKTMSPEQKTQQDRYAGALMDAAMAEKNAHPDERFSDISGRLAMPGIVRNMILKAVPGAVLPEPKTGIMDKIKNEARWELNSLTGQKNPDDLHGNKVGEDAPAKSDVPAAGTIRPGDGGNYRFKGGDQYNPENWEKVKK